MAELDNNRISISTAIAKSNSIIIILEYQIQTDFVSTNSTSICTTTYTAWLLHRIELDNILQIIVWIQNWQRQFKRGWGLPVSCSHIARYSFLWSRCGAQHYTHGESTWRVHGAWRECHLSYCTFDAYWFSFCMFSVSFVSFLHKIWYFGFFSSTPIYQNKTQRKKLCHRKRQQVVPSKTTRNVRRNANCWYASKGYHLWIVF